MATAIGVIVGVVVVLLIAGLVLLAMRRARRRRELQEQYGPEYDRAVEQAGSRSAAERDLAARRDQRAELQIVPLSAESRNRYSQAWSQVQGRFVDDPQGAVTDADDLTTAVMRERGYPTEGFDEQARLLSVDHGATLDNYRSGHHIAGLARQQQATTEQLRQGMVHYRSLFQELVEERESEQGQQFQQGQQQPQGQQFQQQPQGQQFQQQPQHQQFQQQPQHQQPPGEQYSQPDSYDQAPDARPTTQFPRPPSGPMERSSQTTQPMRQTQHRPEPYPVEPADEHASGLRRQTGPTGDGGTGGY